MPSSTAQLRCQEVANRFVEYCRNTFPILDHGVAHHLLCEETQLPRNDVSSHQRSSTRRIQQEPEHITIVKLQMYETENDNSAALSWIGDESLPECLQQILQQPDSSVRRKTLLPNDCKHFLLDITLRVSDNHRLQGISNNNNNEVHVHINGYCHSPHGQKMIDQIKSHLQNDICRTSRRWRRMIKQKEHERINQVSMDE